MDFRGDVQRAKPNPYRGLIWVIVFGLCLAVLAVFMGTDLTGPAPTKEDGAGGTQGPQLERPTSSPAAASRVDAVGATTAPAAAASEPARARPVAETPEKDLPWWLTDPKTLRAEAASAELNTYSFSYLLYQVHKADQTQLAADAVPAPGPEAMMNWEPGKPVSLRGVIFLIERRDDLGVRAVGIPAAIHYEIEGAEGQRYLVFTSEEMQGVGTQDEVSVVGRFLRLYADPRAPKDKSGQPTLTPIILAKAVDGSHLLDDASCLKGIRDGVVGRESTPFFYLANQARNLTLDEIKALVDEELTPDVLAESPADARGRAVMIEGGVLLLQPEPPGPNIAGIPHLYWTIVKTKPGVPVWIYSTEKPKGVRKGDAVRAYGLFFKSTLYRDRNGFERSALIVMARHVIRLKHPESRTLQVVALVAGIAIVVLLFVAVMFERWSARRFARHVHTVAARRRPERLNETAREVAERTRKAQDRPRAADGDVE